MAPKKNMEKNSEAPKKPVTAFFLYMRVNRERLVKAIGSGAIAKVAGVEWKALSQKDKDAWKQRAEDDKQRYARERAEFTAANKNKGKWSGSAMMEREDGNRLYLKEKFPSFNANKTNNSPILSLHMLNLKNLNHQNILSKD